MRDRKRDHTRATCFSVGRAPSSPEGCTLIARARRTWERVLERAAPTKTCDELLEVQLDAKAYLCAKNVTRATERASG